MKHRNKHLIWGMIITMAVVLVCMMAPGILLHTQNSSGVDKIYRDNRQYVADDIQTEGFTLQKRLMMMSGKWNCKKEAIKEPPAFVIPSDIFDQLYSAIMEYTSLQYMFTEYDEWLIKDILIGGNEGGTATLYKYTDEIFNSYTFYAWEYTNINSYGLNCKLLVDAVTMDVYSFSFTGIVARRIRWLEVFQTIMESVNKHLADATPFQIRSWIIPTAPLELQAFLYQYFCMVYAEDISIYDSGLPGYNLKEGNFISKKVNQCEVYNMNGDTYKLISDDGVIYFCTIVEDDGLKMFITADEDELK